MKEMKKPKNKPEVEMKIWPEPVLGFRTAKVSKKHFEGRKLRELVGAMIRTMYQYEGIGLAAPQVGIANALFVMDGHWAESGRRRPRVFINPRMLNVEEPVIEVNHPGEGCLSFPYNYRAQVPRASRVELEWQDLKGKKHTEWFEGMDAILVQHEFDHLLGRLFIDNLGPIKRDLAIRKARKTRRQYAKGMKRGIAMLKHAPRHDKRYLLEELRRIEMVQKAEANKDAC